MIEPQDGFVVGGTYLMKLVATKDSAVWNLTGAIVSLTLRPAGGSALTFTALLLDPQGGVAGYTTLTTDIVFPGRWEASWRVQQSGIDVRSRPDAFFVSEALG